MCRVQREKTWHSGRRRCILWPCQGQNGNPGLTVCLTPGDHRTKTLAGVRRGIGPALIIGAGVVGTGELIATTVLGAENGYSLLWLILVSCTIKVVMQNELGRCAIGTGETGLQALERAPGPRFRASWVVWLWSFMLATSLVTPSGVFAGIS